MKKILIISLILFSSFAQAYNFSATEKLALKTAALAEPSIATCISGGNDVCVAGWFNSESTFVVWRTNVSAIEYHNSAIVWASVDSLTAGKARIWEWMSKYNVIDPSKSNVRQGFVDAFGAGSATTIAATALSKRFSTFAEKSLATGTGTTAVPGFMTFDGQVGVSDIANILRN